MKTILFPSRARSLRTAERLFGGAAFVIATLLAAGVAHATVITVNHTSATVNASDGRCTLPEAVTAVNTRLPSGSVAGECPAGGVSQDIIQLGSATYTLGSTLVVNRDVSINGNGQSIVRTTAQRAIEVTDTNTSQAGPRVNLHQLTIENGRTDSQIVTGVYFGGGTGSPELNISYSTIRNCSNGVRAIGGSAALNQVSLYQVNIENSRADGFFCRGCSANLERTNITGSAGSGIRNESLSADDYPTSSVVVTESTIANNGTTTANGGGIWTGGGLQSMVNLHESTISNNRGADGGGVYSQGSLLAFYTSTISSNTATRGGGVFNAPAPATSGGPGEFNVYNGTIAANVASNHGGGIYITGRQAMLVDTIIANNTDNGASPKSPDCLGQVSTWDSSMIGNDAGCTDPSGGAAPWLFVGNVRLGPLIPSGAASGVKVHPLLKDSPAINAIFKDGIPTGMDQRGLWRPEPHVYEDGTVFQGFLWDPGAVEYNTVWPPALLQVAAYSTAAYSVDSAGYFRFSPTTTGDYITFSVPIAEPGTYDVTGHVGKMRDAGNYRLEHSASVSGTYSTIMSQDLYSSSTTPVKTAMTAGTVTYSSSGFVPGLRYFRFRVLGKHASATAHRLRLSYLKIQKR